jgi:hypothetical protein
MDAETFLGAILIAAWAALVLRGLTRTALAARKRGGCALGVGVVLSIKNSLPLDTFTNGFLLAAGAGFAVWAFGQNPPLQRRSRMPRSSVTGAGKWLLILTAVAVELAGCSSTRLGAKPNQADWPQAQMSTDANRPRPDIASTFGSRLRGRHVLLLCVAKCPLGD